MKLHTVIGFDGTVPSGLTLHPSRQHILYPLGSTLIIKNLLETAKSGSTAKDSSRFLKGHNGPISCVAMSQTGRYVASGQSTHMGFKASVIIWDYESGQIVHKLQLHKVKVQSLAFSADEKYLLSIGGEDDGNVTVWDVQSGKAICGTTTTQQSLCASFFASSNQYFVTAGKFTLRVWQIDFENRKLIPTDCNLGQLKRVITCMKLSDDDQHAFCGTTTGDVLCVQVKGNIKNLKLAGPNKLLSQGVRSIEFTPKGNIILGAGDGTLAVVSGANLRRLKSVNLMGGVTSITATQSGGYYCGTNQSVIYYVNSKLEATLVSTCHSKRINDVVYPKGTSEIIATCSVNDIRLWNAHKGRELVRIQLPNLECNCVCFSNDGSQILSGWSDGRIRAFGPQSGKLLYVINEAHKITGQKKVSGKLLGVTALAVANDNQRVISGGSDGQVRVWFIGQDSQTLAASMKEHKSTVNCIVVRKDDSECVTSSDDGSCIVWSLDRYSRSNIMTAQTYFKQVRYLDDESQIVSAGSDKRIIYWDAYDCSAIREVEASSGEIYALDISPDGESFTIGGSDRKVTMFNYDEGEVMASQDGHSEAVTKLKYSPDQRFLTSVGEEGAILVWSLDE
mmetsp:Transcript_6499/g.24427  ORF Transcript_6499/g.24427 Transcript_6499/m.24427 type:complete len:620 (-) Transcript_6499:219-2078(-)|eukprot:CAMPEP_0117448540 /NCGR_PEP_ID=MMETSP0759-20121206/7454_1 /TAXON_ID=63605 /ORGANISM="Percolomonas cosmopolitus, Strain WS" /LENGTH=619 /DNA_ID=CAMNT_0005240931 /DNA_START=225 /DNA_END=2084 /DNA_ORIENTATION=-